MTLLQEIQSAQTLCIPPFISKRILLRVPLTVVATLNPQSRSLWLFDPNHYDSSDTNDYVYLRLFPQYTPEDDYLGDRAFKPSFNGTVANYSTTRRGFRATVVQSQAFLYYIVERVAAIAATSTYGVYTPIKIIDFCRTAADYDPSTIAIGGEYATIRYGRIDIIKIPSLIRGVDGNDYCKDDWEFKFTSVTLR